MPQVLEALGIDSARHVLWGKRGQQGVRARTLLVPPGADEYKPHWNDELVRAMRGVMVERALNHSYEHGAASDIVLVQRASHRDGEPIRGRAFVNHDEILASLRHLFAGRRVRVFPPDSMPLVEQIKVWHRAAWVLAPHGAGLTNSIFLPPASVGVLELRAAGRKGAVYHHLG